MKKVERDDMIVSLRLPRSVVEKLDVLRQADGGRTRANLLRYIVTEALAKKSLTRKA